MTIKSLFFITHTKFCFLSLLFYKEEWGLQLSERRHCVNYFHQLVNVAGWSWNPFYAFSANLLIPFIIPCFSISFLQLPVFIYRSEMTLFSKTCFAILFKKIFFKVFMTSVQHFISHLDLLLLQTYQQDSLNIFSSGIRQELQACILTFWQNVVPILDFGIFSVVGTVNKKCKIIVA